MFYFFFYRFINARRRIVQPMIDQSNRAGKSPVVTVFKSRRCKSSTSQSPPDISPGNHGNDVFDTGGWKHGKKENEQNCHGDKKLKKIVSETLECNSFFEKFSSHCLAFLAAECRQSPDLVWLTNQRRLSPPPLICMLLIISFALHPCIAC